MNDSFLEDLGLIPEESKKTYQQADCYITTRHATSSPLLKFSEQDERENIMRSQKTRPTTAVPNIPDIKITSSRDFPIKDCKKQPDQNMKKHSVRMKVPEKNEKAESRTKNLDVKIKMDNKQHYSISGDTRTKLQEAKEAKLQETNHAKLSENKIVNKERNRRSGSHKETTQSLGTSTKENKHSSDSSNNHSSDVSSKNNSRPSDSSKESGPQDSAKEKEKVLPANLKKFSYNIQDQDPVVLLSAIKELISTYTKQESTKILRTMQELHINSQATLIKNLLNQTDDLIKEMHPSKDSTRVKMLIEENERLQQELIALKTQNEDLQSKLAEIEFLKQENAALKLKCSELKET
ncbi:uncharacterized protein LOC105185663 [Harpegnathos saltator]|uniref:Uncharacterized protein n=1 Tax=Harpegnathos saltator TaxID=610380 RepID=E2BR38_HARSA|nr:uncharacterized protein LOC105185663 [Harpegnathos saltator]XP_025163623.1 uncharacterized protein LOC105185663 [Harpegnathos saltator]EFN81844.1 hypothetical protein EAI_12334 [Harpegnathos saltator]